VEPGADLSIALTPLSGDQDPDLYVSAPHLPLPTLANHTWASVRFGADALLLQVRDFKLSVFDSVICALLLCCITVCSPVYCGQDSLLCANLVRQFKLASNHQIHDLCLQHAAVSQRYQLRYLLQVLCRCCVHSLAGCVLALRIMLCNRHLIWHYTVYQRLTLVTIL
jgi:hypothetical protein